MNTLNNPSSSIPHPSSFTTHPSSRALFLDRDGTINVNYGYVFEPEKFHFVDGIFDICARAQRAGFKLIVVSNQSGVSRGYYTEAQMRACNDFMCAEFAKRGITIDDVFCCTALDDADPDRKPNPGMFLKAIDKHGLDPAASLAIGDSARDTVAACRAGVGKVVQLGLVSILLPIYNTPEKYLRAAIESLLDQSYENFELLIYNDSPANTALDDIVRSYSDPRIRLLPHPSSFIPHPSSFIPHPSSPIPHPSSFIPHPSSLGIAEAHNLLLDHAVGEFVALQDHDDISMPKRLEHEVEFLKAHPEVGVVSGACWRFGRLFKRHHIRYPLTDEAIRKQFIISMPVLHPACMMRRLPLLEHGIRWDPSYISLNDAKLFLDLMPHVKFANLDEIVYRYRMSRSQTSVTQRAAIAAEIKRFEEYFYGLYPEGAVGGMKDEG